MTSLGDARELARYQDQPRQLRAGTPGKRPHLSLRFERRAGRSVLADVAHRAPLLAQPALYWDEGMPDLPCVFIVSTSGGILQGDRASIEIELGPGASAHVTTQAATKIHAMDANFATQSQEIALGEGAYLEYLPDVVIPFRHARFLSRTRIRVDPTAALLYAEVVLPGRTHHAGGEAVAYDVFSSTVRAERPDGAELFTDTFVIEPGAADVRQVGIMSGFDVFANALFLAPAAVAGRVFAEVPAVVDEANGWAAAASRLPGGAGLIYRVLGAGSEPVRHRVREFWSLVRREVAGASLSSTLRWR